MANVPSPIPVPVTAAGNPAPATEFYKSKALKVVAVLAVLSLAIAMIVGHFSGKSTAEAGAGGAGSPAKGGQISYSSEAPIRFGPSKRIEIDLKVDEWSPLIIAPERCKSVMGAVNPPAGYFIQFPDGKEIEVTPHGREGFLPAKRGEYRFRGVQPGQRLVMHVTY
ncbi:MAG: hypothetical protein G01um10143_397 [Parcubacteria group bacterium Gr01-1014_3]|nr:MAG: hypothetical protein G01um10143_397 [Parcubacteria group bacterium Gr01-1014_3]